MSDYRRNHYVPIWYQKRFFPRDSEDHRLYYLDINPSKKISPSGYYYLDNELSIGGPNKCFNSYDLYTTRFGAWISTEIEQYFFGKIDSDGKSAIEFFADFNYSKMDHEAFRKFIRYLSVQKLRTPKGLDYLRNFAKSNDKNEILMHLQKLRDYHAAIWSESVWSIVKASRSDIKFIISDHPVTVYNMGCFPGSPYCSGASDPPIWLTGTHTIFPLDWNTVIILTNASWLRNHYTSPTINRPNPEPLRSAIFSFLGIQIGRELDDDEVACINYIIKKRAYKYVAAMNKEWLFPERIIKNSKWDSFGRNLLLMPDPRSYSFTTGMLGRFEDGSSFSIDSYGRHTVHSQEEKKMENDLEWISFNAFKGEFARKIGPKRRGLSYEFGKLDNEFDAPEIHKHNLLQESIYKGKLTNMKKK